MRLYGNIEKVDAEQRMVWGYASTEAVDAHGETISKAAIEDALEAYLEYGNIREMHQLSAVGLAKEATVDDKGLWLGAHVVDDTAWGKVTSGVYKGFSIGGKTLARDPDNRKIITKILLNEISLVDRPSNPEAKFDVWKATGGADVTQELAKVVSERDDLSKALADKDDALAKLADRVVSTIAGLTASNDDLRKRNDFLSKQLAAAAPRPVPREVLAAVIDVAEYEATAERVAKTIADLEISMPALSARLDVLYAVRERDHAPARTWGGRDDA